MKHAYQELLWKVRNRFNNSNGLLVGSADSWPEFESPRLLPVLAPHRSWNLLAFREIHVRLPHKIGSQSGIGCRRRRSVKVNR